MFESLREGRANIKVSTEKKIARSMPVFYNPVMAFNRDISVNLLNALGVEDMQIGLPLAGTGVRGIRFFLELRDGIPGSIHMNDKSPEAARLMRKNIRLNKAANSAMPAIKVSSLDANRFLLNSPGFDYIDIDPFGSPNHYLDSAVKRISRRGVLAVTATDTAPLCGTYPDACLRKYWAVPRRDEQMHETGLRILIRKIQLIGAQYDKALVPVYSYSRHHYFRVFFRCRKGKAHADRLMAGHGRFDSTGPMWLGSLWDEKLAEDIYLACEPEHRQFLGIIRDESKIPTIGFFDVHSAAREKKSACLPKIESLLERIRSKGYRASRTHFLKTGIRTDMDKEKFLRLI